MMTMMTTVKAKRVISAAIVERTSLVGSRRAPLIPFTVPLMCIVRLKWNRDTKVTNPFILSIRMTLEYLGPTEKRPRLEL